MLQGLNEQNEIKAIVTRHVSEESMGEGARGTARGSRTGAYTARYVRGKGNILVCPQHGTRETPTSKDKSGRVLGARIHVDDPRALPMLPRTVNGAQLFKVIDRRKKRKPKHPSK